jgi:hypothetical protein
VASVKKEGPPTQPMRERCARVLAGRAKDLAIGERNVLAAVLTAAESGAPIAKRVLGHAAGVLGRFAP